MILGRGGGLVWTLLLISSLGIADYGLYASAYALAAIISAPLENVFVVRSVRVSEAEYLGERTTRMLLGSVLLVAGAALYAEVFVIGFALLVAGAEMLFNVVKSVALREGRPQAIMRYDAIRQYSSIIAAISYLGIAGGSGSLAIACLFYLLPYLVLVVAATRLCLGNRPRVPGGLRENAVLLVDAVIVSLYLQGDILLLGVLASDEVVGVYSVASQLVLALSSIGQLHAQGFNASLRAHGGALHAGPPRRIVVGLGAFFIVGTVLTGLVLALLTPYVEVGWTLVVVSAFSGLRSIDNAWTTILYVQRRDRPRITWAGIALVVKLGSLALLVQLGVTGYFAAAIGAVLAEIVLVQAYTRLVARPLPAGPLLEPITTPASSLSAPETKASDHRE